MTGYEVDLMWADSNSRIWEELNREPDYEEETEHEPDLSNALDKLDDALHTLFSAEHDVADAAAYMEGHPIEYRIDAIQKRIVETQEWIEKIKGMIEKEERNS